MGEAIGHEGTEFFFPFLAGRESVAQDHEGDGNLARRGIRPSHNAAVAHRGMLKQDLFAQVYVIVGEQRRSLTIPIEALISADGAEVAFVERGGSYVRVGLALGTRTDRFAEVIRGLSPGDRVVTDGSRQLYAKWLAAKGGGPALGGHTH